MSAAILPLPHIPSWSAQGYLSAEVYLNLNFSNAQSILVLSLLSLASKSNIPQGNVE